MAVDRDGAVGLLYSVGVGPTTFFAYRGGVLASKALGELTEEELIDRVRRPGADSRKRQDGARIEEPVEAEAPLRRGWVEPALRAEFTGLALVLAEVAAQLGPQPARA